MREDIDKKYMRRALTLAALAEGYTTPNPMVGCVIVENGEIIGEGYHHKAGEPHAEVNAINSVKEPHRLKNSTLYVNLEPCSHYGRTPPCSEKIIANSIKRVVIGCVDTFAKVNGRGIKMLEDAGIEVTVGVLEKESRELNRRFFTFYSKKRPFIILKWAQTCDGYIDNDRDSDTPATWLTGVRCKEVVHKMRKTESGIMVGSRTVERDNPSLTVRNWSGKNPIRIVIDRELRLESRYNIFNDEAATLIFNKKVDDGRYVKIDFDSENWIDELLDKLYSLEIFSVIVEGGTTLLNQFTNRDLYDEALIFISPLSLQELKGSNSKKGIEAPLFPWGKKIETDDIDGVIVKKISRNDFY